MARVDLRDFEAAVIDSAGRGRSAGAERHFLAAANGNALDGCPGRYPPPCVNRFNQTLVAINGAVT